jgi:bilirubin oxidase
MRELQKGREGSDKVYADQPVNSSTHGESPLKHLLANLPRATTEIWKLEDKSGGWTHPVHVYLIGLEVLQPIGRGVEPLRDTGLKDVVKLGNNEQVLVEAHYTFLNVMAALELGYNEETHFFYSEDPRWSVVAFGQADWTGVSGQAASSAAWADTSAQKRSVDDDYKDRPSGTISRVRPFVVCTFRVPSSFFGMVTTSVS